MSIFSALPIVQLWDLLAGYEMVIRKKAEEAKKQKADHFNGTVKNFEKIGESLMSTETYLQPDASRIACDVFVREKVLGPEDVVYGIWHVVISIPANVQGPPLVWVGLAEGDRRLWPVPADWRMTKKDCEKVAVEFIEKLKKEGLA